MQQKRGYAFGVATEGKIFVAGGRENCASCLKTCEMFNISTNEWQLIGSLNVTARVYSSMVCLKEHSMCWVVQVAHGVVLNAMTLQRTSGTRRQPYQ